MHTSEMYSTQEAHEYNDLNDMSSYFERKFSNIPFATPEDKKQWREKSHEITKEFRSALEKYFGLKSHPKADKVWTMAWQRGHSEGYYSVANEYAELVELIS